MKAFSNHITSLAARVCVACVGMQHTHSQHVDGCSTHGAAPDQPNRNLSLEDSLAALSPADVNEQVVCLVLSLAAGKKGCLTD